ncbi:MAG: hypothetical protein H6718_04230 [Polyangiaceae bacterium]|nr:hypothetical protein [Polyangiaceae bacterium]
MNLRSLIPTGTPTVEHVTVTDEYVEVMLHYQHELSLHIRTSSPAAGIHLLWVARALLNGKRPSFIKGTSLHVELPEKGVIELSSVYRGIGPFWNAIGGGLGWLGDNEVASVMAVGPMNKPDARCHVFHVPAPRHQEPWQWPTVECSVVTEQPTPWRTLRLKPDMRDSYMWGLLTRSLVLFPGGSAPEDRKGPKFIVTPK